MRARLDGQRQTLRLRGPDQVERAGVGQVQDVRAGARAAHRVDHARDRVALADGGAAGQEVGVPRPERAVGVQVRGVLGVHDQHAAERGDLRQRGLQLLGVEVPELVDPRRGEERLEPADARRVQRTERPQVVRHGPAPERHVDAQLAVRRGPLGGQRLDRRGGRDRVERHVDERRDPTGRRGAGGRREALPRGAARLVDVHVAVDQAGQQHLVVGELDGRAVVGDVDRRDAPAAHHDLRGSPGAVHPGASRADDEVRLGHGGSRGRLLRQATATGRPRGSRNPRGGRPSAWRAAGRTPRPPTA